MCNVFTPNDLCEESGRGADKQQSKPRSGLVLPLAKIRTCFAWPRSGLVAFWPRSGLISAKAGLHQVRILARVAKQVRILPGRKAKIRTYFFKSGSWPRAQGQDPDLFSIFFSRQYGSTWPRATSADLAKGARPRSGLKKISSGSWPRGAGQGPDLFAGQDPDLK